MEPHPQDSIQLLLAVCWPWVQEYLKNAKWAPWITQDTKAFNRWLSLFVAAASTAGFHLSGSAGTGWTLMIPPLSALAHIVAQFTTQHIVYTSSIETPNKIKAIEAMLTPPKQ